MDLQTFKGFVEFNESFVNALPTDEDLKNKYKHQVWNVLQLSYKKIGGVKGSGFRTVDDMLNIPMWKMNVINGEVVAVVLYKDKGGRKSVAMGTDGTMEGARKIADILRNELKRSYGEKSKAALGSVLKMYPEDALKPFLFRPEQVAQISKGDGIVPVSLLPEDEIPEDGKVTIAKYPYVRDFAYLREIGGNMTFKVMIGTPSKTIK